MIAPPFRFARSLPSFRSFLSLVCPLPLLLAAGACRPAPPPALLRLEGRAMGTTWHVTLRSASSPDVRAVRRGIAQAFEQVEAHMSQWRRTSLVSRFNRTTSTTPFPITEDLATVIRESQRIYKMSTGAFDVTCAPLVNLWGFGPTGPRGRVPSDAEIRAALLHVGQDRLRLVSTPEGTALVKQDPAIQIDLSALAKGFAVDHVAAFLDTVPISDYLVECGGELRARGSPALNRAWEIGLEEPNPAVVNRIRSIVCVTNQAVATSGNYRLFFTDPTRPGRRYSHIVNPHTGRPVSNSLVSVSVIAGTTMRADALATALMVLGPHRGFRWAVRHHLAATFVSEKASEREEISTSAFLPFLKASR